MTAEGALVLAESEKGRLDLEGCGGGRMGNSENDGCFVEVLAAPIDWSATLVC